MFAYGLSKKQCGVLFGAIKRGQFKVAEGFINWMYNRIADQKCFLDNSVMVDVFASMKVALDAFFAGEIETAETEANRAYTVYTAHFAA